MDVDELPPQQFEFCNLNATDNKHHERESSPALPSLPAALTQSSKSQIHKRPSLRPRLSSSRKRLFKTNASTEEQADLLAAAFNTSSDPAFFSSDDTPDLENYSIDSQKKRKKKVYSGTWWGGRLRSSSNAAPKTGCGNDNTEDGCDVDNEGRRKRKRDRQFKRNFDSGIFMADDTDSNTGGSGCWLSSDSVTEEEVKTQQPLVHLPFAKPFKKLALHDLAPRKLSPVDEAVARVVHHCLETGNSSVDLTNMGIDNLPPSVVELRTLVDSKGPSDMLFAPLSCRIRIYLANNQLLLFPGQLLKVTNIELLSLRQNQLSRIPDEVSELKQLREINLSCNNLEHLPFSILKMSHMKLRRIHSEPNPWKRVPPVPEQLTQLPGVAIHRNGRSIVRFVVGQALENNANGDINQHKTNRHQSVPGGKIRRSPYLSEVVLRQLSKLHTAGTDLSTSPDMEFCPDSVKSMLHQLYRTQHEGSRRCTFCNRSLVVPRYEWLEWWGIKDVETSRDEVGPVETRYEIWENANQFSTDKEEDADSGDRSIKEDEPSLRRDVLPFLRVGCGCRTQVEGLEEEMELWRRLATATTSAAANDGKDESNGEGDKMTKGWPTLFDSSFQE